MRIFCCQLDIVWEDKQANFRKVRRLLEETVPPKRSLVVLPEMFATGFTMNPEANCDLPGGETDRFLQGLARQHEITVIAGQAVRDADGRARNQAVVVSPAGVLVGRYNKVHPFSLGGEAEHYAAGHEVVIFQWEGCTVAPLICYDLRFPELFRTAVRRGTQVFTVIANWPVKREMHWVTLLQARAIENQAYVVGVNRSGTDPKYTYSGRSMIVDPHGTILCEIGNEEGIISAAADLAGLETWRKDFPALQDMHWNG